MVRTAAALRSFDALAFPAGSPGRVCAAGDYASVGYILLSLDGGTTWGVGTTPVGIGPVVSLAVDPGSPGTVYAAAPAGVLKSTDGCATWNLASTGLSSPANVVAVDPGTAGTVYAGTGTTLFESTNGAGSWAPSGSGLVESSIQAVAADPSSPGTAYAAVLNDGIVKTLDGGDSWNPAGFGSAGGAHINVFAIDSTSPGTVYAGGYGGGANWVWKTVSGGTSWIPASVGFDPTTFQVYALAVDPLTPGTVYAGGSGFTPVHKTTNGGITWTPTSTGLPAPEGNPIRTVRALAIEPATPMTLYAALGASGVHKTANGGAAWSPANAGLPIGSVMGLVLDPNAPGTLYAAVFNAGVFKTVDGGGSWTAAGTGLTSLRFFALALDPDRPEILYLGTDDAGVFLTADGATTWSAINGGLTTLDVTSLAVDPTDTRRVYAATDGGGVFVRDACGDGVQDPGEGCDDGNRIDGDCCSSTCALPVTTCQPGASGRGLLVLRDGPPDGDLVTWRWVSGAGVALAAFGSPSTTTDLTLCVLDQTGGVPTLRMSAQAPAGGTCGTNPCWTERATVATFSDPRRTGADGLVRIRLRSANPGAAAIRLRGRGSKLGLPALPMTPPVTVRLLRSDAPTCWEATTAAPRRNDATVLRASPD